MDIHCNWELRIFNSVELLHCGSMSWQPYWVEYRHVVQYFEPVSTNLTDCYIRTYVCRCTYVLTLSLCSSVLCLAAEES